MIPLQVTARTPHGVVLSRPWGVALDGLLASVVWERTKWAVRFAGGDLTYRPEQVPGVVDLPLAICGDPQGDDWHWMATFAELHPHTAAVTEPDVRWRTSRTDHRRLHQLAPVVGKVVSDATGRYQNRVIPVLAHPASHLTWRAVGDPERIASLLTELPSIGKHRGVGEGLVAAWEVTALPEASMWSAGHEHQDGVLGRTSPPRCLHEHPDVLTGPLGVGALRPPYLHPASRATAYQPSR
jgi:CRISPR type IV-associated protein Csf3